MLLSPSAPKQERKVTRYEMGGAWFVEVKFKDSKGVDQTASRQFEHKPSAENFEAMCKRASRISNLGGRITLIYG